MKPTGITLATVMTAIMALSSLTVAAEKESTSEEPTQVSAAIPAGESSENGADGAVQSTPDVPARAARGLSARRTNRKLDWLQIMLPVGMLGAGFLYWTSSQGLHR